jgi:hypothetical protein
VYENPVKSKVEKTKKREKSADQKLNERSPHCSDIVRQTMIVDNDQYYRTHCKKCGE